MFVLFFLMIRRPPRSTRTDTLFPYTTLFLSHHRRCVHRLAAGDLALSRPGLPDRAEQPARRIPTPSSWFHRGRIFLQPVLVYRSEEHTSELQSLMRISYAVFCLKKKKTQTRH